MVLENLTKEDEKQIMILTRDILSRAKSVSYKRFLRGKKGDYAQRFVGASENDFKKRQKRDKFSFFSEVEAGFALYSFFANVYNAKHVAKNVYIRCEDEKFKEQFDAQIPLGMVVNSKGELETTSVCEVEIKVIDTYRRPLYQVMPFAIVDLRLVPAEA